MKWLLIGLFSFGVFAQQIGNFAEYSQKVLTTDGDLLAQGVVRSEVIGFEENGNIVLVQETELEMDGTVVNTDVTKTPLGEFITPKVGGEILQSCSQIAGKIQTIKVVAGTFRTCRINQESGNIWLGKVPFGIVKFTLPVLFEDVDNLEFIVTRELINSSK